MKERSCQSFSASHIGPRAECPFHRPMDTLCISALLLTADQNEKDSLVPDPVSLVLSKMAAEDNLSTEQDSKDTGVH